MPDWPGMFLADEAQQLPAWRIFFGDAIADVRAVEALHEQLRILQLQSLDHFAARGGVGSCRERNARHGGIAFCQHRELQVFLAEVMAPLRDAVGLVDREQGDLQLVEQRQPAFGDQALGCEIEQIQLAGAGAPLDGLHLLEILGRVQELGAHAGLVQRRHLILHQRDQR